MSLAVNRLCRRSFALPSLVATWSEPLCSMSMSIKTSPAREVSLVLGLIVSSGFVLETITVTLSSSEESKSTDSCELEWIS